MNMDKERRAARDRRYRERHREAIRERQACWYRANREAVIERSRARYARLRRLAAIGEAAMSAAASASRESE